MNTSQTSGDLSPAQLIDRQVEELRDWRGAMLAQLRRLVHEAVPGIAEEWKWGTAVWTRGGMVCSVGVFKDHVKVNFFKGAALEDPKGLFNAGLEAKTSRGIDFKEGDSIDAAALVELIRAAAEYNLSAKKKG